LFFILGYFILFYFN